MKKCSNCGKMNLNDAVVCKSCQCEFAESVETQIEEIDKKEKPKQSSYDGRKEAEGCLAAAISFIPLIIILHILRFLKQLFSPVKDMYSIENTLALFPSEKDSLIILALAAVISILIGVGIVVSWKLKSPERKEIEMQFEKDQTSICPVCGSHDISLGRKGYDWNKGFWYSVFKVRGGHYLAGMDSRRVTAYCNKCGHKWETDQKWIR